MPVSGSFFLNVYLGFLFFVWTRRIFWLNRLRKKNPPIQKISTPVNSDHLVSVIVPAKNEEKNIANCLYHLFCQNYKNYEIIVVDDRSTDKTPHLLENFQKLSPVPFRIIRIEKLPPGWTGKNHAMFAGSKAANGDWLLFTDADTTHHPESIASALATAQAQNIDFLTLAPETESRSFWEKTVQPLAVGSLALWFNSEKVNRPKSSIILANGQFILVRKEVYEKTGGNEAVKNEVVEDVELAKNIRAAGFSVQFLNGTLLYSTRMYSSLREIKTGWTRIFTYLFNKNIPAILHKIFLFLFVSLFPFMIFLMELIFKLTSSGFFNLTIFILSLTLCSWIILIRFVGNKMVKSDPWYAFLHPLGSMIMIWILSACLIRIIFNRPSAWRGDLHP